LWDIILFIVPQTRLKFQIGGNMYFEIFANLFIGIFLVIIFHQYLSLRKLHKKSSDTLESMAIVMKFIHLKNKRIGGMDFFNDDVLKDNFSKEQLELLAVLGYIRKEENFKS
jgi:hypothetical protein